MQCRTRVSESLRLSFPVYPETVILSALGPGGYHPRHADNCQQDASGRWVPDHTPQRVVTAIYYLNSDFDGGEIVFEREGLAIKPRAGVLLAFPSDRHHVHEVLPVRRGMRYTIPIWFTRRKKAALSGFDRPAATLA
jgi:predicted 2-oxoglutarate/Fe(II)-dependent dioxygenase YbiX